MLESFFLRPDDIKQKIFALLTNRVDYKLNVFLAVTFAVAHCDCDVVQTRAVIAHEGLRRRWQFFQMVNKIRRVVGGKYFGRAVRLAREVHALGHVGRGVLILDVV